LPDVRMPRLSDTMTEGILSQWLKHEGEQVSRGDVLAEIETDKATMELEADDSGVLTRILVEPGTTVPIGQPIAVIGEPDAAAPQAAAAPAAAAPQPTRPPAAGPAAPRSAEVRTSPLARAIARQHGLDIATITGTGPGGRIVRADVQDAVAARDRATTPAPTAPAGSPAPAGSAAPGSADTEVRLNSIRRITAQRLTESAAAPHFYLTSVVDAQPLLALRSELNTQLAGATGAPRISVTDLLVCACAIALRAHPGVNSSWAGDHLVQRGQVNIGLAVALPDGLIVPVIRDADQLSLAQIEKTINDFGTRARDNKLKLEELQGGTFTISNGGVFGSLMSTPILNTPQSGILGMHRIQKRAMVEDDQIVIRPMMYLALSYDHRLVDGREAVTFLVRVKENLEDPQRLLLDV